MGAADDRLRSLAAKRLEASESIVATCRVWYSRPLRVPILAARYRDFVVVTDRRLMMYSAGWLTRLPRRRVLADRLADLTVSVIKVDRSLMLSHPGHPPMRLDFASDAPSTAARSALEALSTTAPAPAPPGGNDLTVAQPVHIPVPTTPPVEIAHGEDGR